jgi:hypothetical protein
MENRNMTEEKRELEWVSIDVGADGATVARWSDAPFPPRDPGDLVALTSSVRILGVLSPILVRRDGESFQIVCGYRRFLAARAAGLDSIPALVANLSDAQAIRCYLSENLLRKPLDGRSEDEALAILKSLRDAWPDDPELSALEEKVASRKLKLDAPNRLESGAAPRGALTARDAGSPLSDSEPSHRSEDRAERILTLAHAYFEEVHATRSINVPRTEILIDGILELADGNAPLSIAGFTRMIDGDLTAPHSILVTQICAHVARVLDWSEENARTFALSGFLHDVGMVFVHDLAKAPRALRADEGRGIQNHTRIGCALITGAREWSTEVALAARDHHERWNGTGYPAGLKGTETGFPARALGLIDAFAALTTPRPHRNALEPGFARERLAQAMNLGLFDPALAPVLGEGLATVPRYEGDAPGECSPLLLTRNSVELRGDLTTMLAKGST